MKQSSKWESGCTVPQGSSANDSTFLLPKEEAAPLRGRTRVWTDSGLSSWREIPGSSGLSGASFVHSVELGDSRPQRGGEVSHVCREQ